MKSIPPQTSTRRFAMVLCAVCTLAKLPRPAAAGESQPPAEASVAEANAAPPAAKTSSFDPNLLVIIKTESGTSKSTGSGFIATVNGKDYIYTNAHVICGSPGSFVTKITSIKTAGGRQIPVPYEVELSDTYDKDSDHGLEDVARFPVVLKEGEKAYEIAGVEGDAYVTQRVVAYGNSLGSDVVTSLPGKVLALGPDRLEISCEIVGGNSGGPVVLPDKNQVIGISTYADAEGTRDLWASGTTFDKVRRFAVRPEKVTKWRRMTYPTLLATMNELNAFDRDTLSLAAACFLNPKPNRGGFDIPTEAKGNYIIKQVILDGGKHSLGATISNGIARVNSRLGGAAATMSMAAVVPIFGEFFNNVARASASQCESLRTSSRAPYLKQFIPEMIELRQQVQTDFIREGATRFR